MKNSRPCSDVRPGVFHRFRFGKFLLCEFCVTHHFTGLLASDGVDVEPLEEDFRSCSGRSEVDLDKARAFLFGLAGDVVDSNAVLGLHDIVFYKGEEVGDTAADVALETKMSRARATSLSKLRSAL